MKKYTKKKIISGMRPTGRIHLGNYNGVLKNWIKLQNENECFFFIADIHALTDYKNDYDIKKNIETMIIEWIASGINPKKCNIYIQSNIPEIFEMHLLLSMITPISWLKRIPTYKENTNLNKEVTYGFLGYPILQGADILILKAKYVPIGEDQLPHLEIIREIVRKLNNIYKEKTILIEPKPILSKYPKILGIDGTKMSKSKNNTILISDHPNKIAAKINRMKTDENRTLITKKGNPEKCSIWGLHKIYSKKIDQIYIENSCKTATIGCVQCKKNLATKIIKNTEIIREKIKILKKDKQLIKNIIKKSNKKIRKIAKNTLMQIKSTIKLI